MAQELLIKLAGLGGAGIAESLALFLIPFIHEDVAILGAAMLIVDQAIPVTLAFASLYAGIVLSDFAVYSCGVLAGRNRTVRRWVAGPRLGNVGSWLDSHLVRVVALSRVVPGLLFPAFIACGLCRISFARFAVVTMAAAALYAPAMLALAVFAGEAAVERLGVWVWWLFLALGGLMALARGRKSNWSMLARMAEGDGSAAALPRQSARSHRGMPMLNWVTRSVSLAERIPVSLFYVPIAAQWLWLGLRHGSLTLPTAADPMIEAGGMWGESKSACMALAGPLARSSIAPFIAVITRSNDDSQGSVADDVARACAAMAEAGLEFPVVVKPDIGWRGFGVRLVADEAALKDYLAAFPAGETVILQQPVLWDGEAGVHYGRMPGEAEGRLFSLTFRYFPHVVGNGVATLRDLVLCDERASWKSASHLGTDRMHLGAGALMDLDSVPAAGEVVRLAFIGSNRVGGLYRDAGDHITPMLTRRIDEIAKDLPEFWFGRLDIRFESVERLEQGERFSIIEVNGIGGESIDVWDPAMPVREVYRRLFRQQAMLFAIGACNRARGFRPQPVVAFLRCAWRQQSLIRRYPPSG
jgi:membrane protein DedA with SNARE-associated domain